MGIEPNRDLSVLFVCLGNICRSPTAQGVFERLLALEGLADRIGVDSAGTASYHLGAAPDPRSVEAAARRGYDLSALRARQVQIDDFYHFDYLLAMDQDNLRALQAMAPADSGARVTLLLAFTGESGCRDVPDPYHGGEAGFDRVLDLVEAGSRGLLGELKLRLPC